jgi:HD-GYP domain-containing protein (c-di-GMP phosphodiesterase class II)/Tfp pilus assembly protein PilF
VVDQDLDAATDGFAATSVSSVSPPSQLLQVARRYDGKGHMEEAIGAYQLAIRSAEVQGDPAVLAEGLRRLAVARHRRQECGEARALCERSYQVALSHRDATLTVEALNTQAGFELVEENYELAKRLFSRALSFEGVDPELRGRIEQNLGTVESIQGDQASALAHYQRSLDAFTAATNEPGCAIAYHNLGVIHAERKAWEEADRCFRLSLKIVEQTGDRHLHGLGVLNRAEVLAGLGRLKEARIAAESAVCIFDELRAPVEIADAYRMLGMVCREAGEFALAGARLRLAVEFAAAAGSAMSEAEALRELAYLQARTGGIDDALELLVTATARLSRLKPCMRPAEMAAGRYPAVVAHWGELVRLVDLTTYEHMERVAIGAGEVARGLGYDESGQARVRVGAYLHDVGKLRVPSALRNKSAPHTGEELAILHRHPVWSAELLAPMELPWDITAIIRGHQERLDGSGYPFRVQGDQIPVEARIIGMVDYFDSRGATLADPEACRRWWGTEVCDAFYRSLAACATEGPV